jgi:hypothetical protein
MIGKGIERDGKDGDRYSDGPSGARGADGWGAAGGRPSRVAARRPDDLTIKPPTSINRGALPPRPGQRRDRLSHETGRTAPFAVAAPAVHRRTRVPT